MAAPDPSHEPERTDGHPGDGVSRGTARMEAFADAVFAIAFTLPVVEIELPDGDGPLWPQLAELWPSYVGYVLAALVIGTYWVHHHFTGAIYRTTGHYFNLATTLFLMVVAFIAFPARAFAEHLPGPERGAGAIFFLCAFAAIAIAWRIKWAVGLASGHVDDRLDRAYVGRLNRMYWRSTIGLTLAAALGFAYWPAGLALAGLILVRYLVPPETPVYVTEAPAIEGEG